MKLDQAGQNNLPNQPYKLTGKELEPTFGLNWYDFGARTYDMSMPVWGQIDELAEKHYDISPYAYCLNNPVRYNDPDGRDPDWVQGSDRGIKWDKNANSQASTKSGETYLGKTLSFKFNSYIDAKLWDGPNSKAPGDKLTSTITVTGNENSAGELTSITTTKQNPQIGETPVGKARDYFPELGEGQNKYSVNKTTTGININYEQHASVLPIEEAAITVMGYNIVNVAQKLDLTLSGNKLSVSASTDIFPSATLSVNNKQLFHYSQPSFKATHSQYKVLTPKGTIDLNKPKPAFYSRYKSN